ncbi:MAG TPA: hypothetical protein VJ813_15675 [Vicinamibacterales bacterium]|nr:hypothetical protein [Vicinamibacterales bacterium]
MSTALSRIDSSMAVTIVAAAAFLAACLTSRPFARTALLVVQAAWAYVSNFRG